MSKAKTKTCSACEQEKPLDDFHNYAAGKDGKYPRCKQCGKYGAPIEMGKHDTDFEPFDHDLEATRRAEQLVARFGEEAARVKIRLERFAT